MRPAADSRPPRRVWETVRAGTEKIALPAISRAGGPATFLDVAHAGGKREAADLIHDALLPAKQRELTSSKPNLV